MDIIITGLGAVGIEIMQQLSSEGHNIVVIDTDAKKVEKAVEEYDVRGVIGNGASSEILKEASIGGAEIFIATTSHDELNILCCLIAQKLGAKKTIARASKPEYLHLFKHDGDMGLNLMVNPQYEAAMEIARMLKFPSAITVREFSTAKVELVEFRVEQDSPLVGLSLLKLRENYNQKFLICAAQRKDEAIIPKGDFVIEAEDRLFITAPAKEIASFFKQLKWNKPARNVMIVGGSTTAYYLCEELEKEGIRPRLVERNAKKATAFAENFNKLEVILGDGTDHELLQEEGIGDMDAFVALGNSDEQNIIMSLFATSQDVKKVVTKIDQLSYYDMLQRSGIYSAVSTKTSTADQIVRFARRMAHASGGTIKRFFRIIDDSIEILEFKTNQDFKMFDVPLSNRFIKHDILLAGILRGGELITPSGDDCIKNGDNVIVVTSKTGLNDLNDIVK